MTFTLFRCRFTISFYFAAMLAAMLLLDRTGIMPLSVFAALLHEAGHFLIMLACGQAPREVTLQMGRAE
ncbi:MAG: hypothetical protein LBQ48_01155, partial [Oscillospiraceae bacterium]|nr:hypothetical protein [Oscillospiraceae bacterium]